LDETRTPRNGGQNRGGGQNGRISEDEQVIRGAMKRSRVIARFARDLASTCSRLDAYT